ncbi:hypothetical protein AALP_AA3G363400 [Arabis alpina]|uniref:Uncharacterized protein n=1 Tax=Arabis alpina TaxID=50452 RepID=A0A087HE04_ARAAL|nr:hypothetical protein AALP_AA3G363400 [Arabis alpina]
MNMGGESSNSLETKVNMMLETMEELAHRLQQIEAKVDRVLATKDDRLGRIEAKVDLLATKDDLEAAVNSLKGKQVPSKKPLAKSPSKDKNRLPNSLRNKSRGDGPSRPYGPYFGDGLSSPYGPYLGDGLSSPYGPYYLPYGGIGGPMYFD